MPGMGEGSGPTGRWPAPERQRIGRVWGRAMPSGERPDPSPGKYSGPAASLAEVAACPCPCNRPRGVPVSLGTPEQAAAVYKEVGIGYDTTMQLQSKREAGTMADQRRIPTTEMTGDATGTTGSTIPRFYMSGDLRAATGLSRTQLDYYLREGVVRPTARTESGYLLFDEGEREVVEQIIAWREEGVGLKDIRQRLHREEAS